MNHGAYAYGLWGFAAIDSAIFIIFAFSFTHPHTKRDWRSFGAFSSFLVALFSEMYGFPLTIYLFSGWLSHHYPGVDLYSHNDGHLWYLLLGLKGDAMFNPIHILSELVILTGFLVLASAWRILYKAQKEHTPATTGAYAYVRHPQYDGFMLIMVGFLLMWPTLLTLAMFPILVVMYMKLAHREERAVRAEYGEDYERYAALTPRYVPQWPAKRIHSHG